MTDRIGRRGEGPDLPLLITARLVRPIQQFVRTEVAGGIVLIAAALLAVAWANSPWDHTYFDLLHREIVIDLSWISIDKDVQHLVNDGLMTVFFFVVGLEIKRELVQGELATRERAMLPAGAALGGMVVPAAIYLVLNSGSSAAHGWGIPMATDIAFALGILALLGPRVPFGAKVFLLALAIVDDLGAIVVIALFYTEEVSGPALAASAVILTTVVIANRWGVRSIGIYWALGIVFWLAVFKSGIHATLAGVVLAMLTPSRAPQSPANFVAGGRHLLDEYEAAHAKGDTEAAGIYAARLEQLTQETESPLDRLEHALHPWVSFVVVPLFALANAGLAMDGEFFADAARSNISLGVAAGLFFGKVVGITLFTTIAVRLRLGALPAGMTLRHLVGTGFLGGIGFTVSLFIADLAFDEALLKDEAKAGVFAASVVAAILGLLWLRFVAPPAPPSMAAGRSPTAPHP